MTENKVRLATDHHHEGSNVELLPMNQARRLYVLLHHNVGKLLHKSMQISLLVFLDLLLLYINLDLFCLVHLASFLHIFILILDFISFEKLVLDVGLDSSFTPLVLLSEQLLLVLPNVSHHLNAPSHVRRGTFY